MAKRAKGQLPGQEGWMGPVIGFSAIIGTGLALRMLSSHRTTSQGTPQDTPPVAPQVAPQDPPLQVVGRALPAFGQQPTLDVFDFSKVKDADYEDLS